LRVGRADDGRRPVEEYEMTLTGRFNFRKPLMGKIVLQVEEERPARWPFASASGVRHLWRDARSLDLALPELRGLIELRDFIQEHPHANYGALGGHQARKRWEQDAHRDALSAPEGGHSGAPATDASRKVQGLTGR
jgi:hypothetical protein